MIGEMSKEVRGRSSREITHRQLLFIRNTSYTITISNIDAINE